MQRGGRQGQALFLSATHGARTLLAQAVQVVGLALRDDARIDVARQAVQIRDELQVLLPAGGQNEHV